MAELFSTLWPLTFVAPILLYVLSIPKAYGLLRGSAVHPFNVLGFFLIYVALNFLYVFGQVESGNLVPYARHTISNSGEVTAGLLFFLLMSAAILFGVIAAVMRPQKVVEPPALNDKARKAAKWIFWGVALLGAGITGGVVLQSLSMGSLFYIAGTRQLFFRDNPLALIVSYALVPCAVLYMSNLISAPRKRWIVAIVAILLILPLGSRSSVLYIAIAMAVSAVLAGQRIPVLALYVAAPVVAGFLFVLRFFRESSQTAGADFGTFLQVNSSELVFGSMDFSTAEPIILGANYDLIDRYPFETFVAAIFAIIPRSILSWKPEGPSTEFSALSDPARWAAVQGEWVITGFTNLKVELGFAGAAVVLALLSYVWARFVRGARDDTRRYMFVSTYGIMCAFSFIRGDIYGLSLLMLWPMIAVLTAHRVFMPFIRGAKPLSSRALSKTELRPII